MWIIVNSFQSLRADKFSPVCFDYFFFLSCRKLKYMFSLSGHFCLWFSASKTQQISLWIFNEVTLHHQLHNFHLSFFYKILSWLRESFECCFSICRFSSGDLTAESEDVESQQGELPAGTTAAVGRPIPPPLQQQPMPGGPPNIPPPPGLYLWNFD